MVILSERKMHVVILTVEFIRSLLHQGTCSVKHNTNDGHCSLFDLGKKATVSCVYQQLVTSTQEKVKVHQRVKQKNTSEYLCITELVYSCLRHSIFTNISPKNHNPSLTFTKVFVLPTPTHRLVWTQTLVLLATPAHCIYSFKEMHSQAAIMLFSTT